MSRATRVLVTGAAGQVGVDLVDVLGGVVPPGGDRSFQPDGRSVPDGEFEVLGLTRHDLDVSDRDAVLRAIRASRPDVIVHLAAYTAVDRAETESRRCASPSTLRAPSPCRSRAHEIGAHLITISTDYVFDGNKGGAYVEGGRDQSAQRLRGVQARRGVALLERRHRRAHLVGHGGARQERRPRHRRTGALGRDRAIRERPDRHRHRRERPGARAGDAGA